MGGENMIYLCIQIYVKPCCGVHFSLFHSYNKYINRPNLVENKAVNPIKIVFTSVVINEIPQKNVSQLQTFSFLFFNNALNCNRYSINNIINFK